VRTIGVITTSRADFGIYLPILRRILLDPDLRLHLYVTGMHLAPEFGQTVRWIEEEQIPIAERLLILVSGDNAEATSKSMGQALIAFAQSYARFQPDLLVVLGDRFEMISAALAAIPFRIPVAHIHGGELTSGAIDDAIRHATTKLAHLHFVSNEIYARRVAQLGEDPSRIIISGAPALDYLRQVPLPNPNELENHLQMPLDPAPLIVTFHPTTLDPLPARVQIQAVLQALDRFDRPVIFTSPNADPGGLEFMSIISDYCSKRSRCRFIKNLGTRYYFGLLGHALAMVGNSSSGIIEAPSFKLPVVNIGSRQDGRVKARNVIDVSFDVGHIQSGIQKAIDDDFRSSLRDLQNPYDAGRSASEIIVDALKSLPVDKLIYKRFRDEPAWSLEVDASGSHAQFKVSR
jgi:UDP-N-acetylglucosamine 2-epimerase (non-hydrolysing)/GDP/UDP-N,N'-diacetylbacillosamine 2-epimerase (hydrolysing)